MSNALTLNDMSPALRKVVETRSHESHRRKSRMREIRSSGSGEGPGWATSRPTLQRTFCHRRRQDDASRMFPPHALVNFLLVY